MHTATSTRSSRVTVSMVTKICSIYTTVNLALMVSMVTRLDVTMSLVSRCVTTGGWTNNFSLFRGGCFLSREDDRLWLNTTTTSTASQWTNISTTSIRLFDCGAAMVWFVLQLGLQGTAIVSLWGYVWLCYSRLLPSEVRLEEDNCIVQN